MGGLSFTHRPVLSALRVSRTQGLELWTHLPTNPFGVVGRLRRAQPPIMPKLKMKIITSVALLFGIGLFTMAVYAAESRQAYTVLFPKITLLTDDSEGIEEVRLSVACGHIEAISKIPNDWNIQVVRAISAVEQLNASAGHGGSRLPGIEKLNGAIRIAVLEKECFDVSAIILISGRNIRQIELPRSKLKLLP
jgi:hypothetical protein